MIASVTGKLRQKAPTEVVLDVHGVGYLVNIPITTFEDLGKIGETVTLHTYLHVREDAQQLYGFSTMGDREMFKMLISVTGIGPRMALGILSRTPVPDLRAHLSSGDVSGLTSAPGVGKKLAERLVIELRDKLSKMELPADHRSATGVHAEAIMALVSLGYNRQSAEKAVRSFFDQNDGKEADVESVLKSVLRANQR